MNEFNAYGEGFTIDGGADTLDGGSGLGKGAGAFDRGRGWGCGGAGNGDSGGGGHYGRRIANPEIGRGSGHGDVLCSTKGTGVGF